MTIDNNTVTYTYGNMPIPGGGYVTGFVFHPTTPNILYARTDIGGTYRYDFDAERWIPLSLHATHEDPVETFPIELALDSKHPNRLYMVCGRGGAEMTNGFFCISDDYGTTFTRRILPCSAHGNWPGRGTGSRLVVDPNNSDIIYYASQRDGLFRSLNRGESWEFLPVHSTESRKNELKMSFVFVAPNSNTIVVGTNGESNMLSEETRGHSLYVSFNAGTSFSPFWQPKVFPGDYTPLMGYVGHRYDFDGKYLYITMNHTGKNTWTQWEGYSCDSGMVIGGRVIRYEYNRGQLMNPVDITPNFPQYGLHKNKLAYTGFGGISSVPKCPGQLYLTTINCCMGDLILHSKDYGETWEVKLHNLEIGNLNFRASYMKAEYNGGRSVIHWMSDIKCNPFDENHLVFNTGTGAFMGYHLQNEHCYFTDSCDGMEETVHMNVYAPTGGDTMVLDMVGDLGGFAFTEEGVACENTFTDECHNRYITCLNADYADEFPNICVATPRGNWTGKTKGGLIVSHDGMKTNHRPELPWGITPELDKSLDFICEPNRNSGWVALGADGQSLVWTIATRRTLPSDQVVFSHDLGQHYGHSVIYNLRKKSVKDTFIKPFSDRVNPKFFYGFGPDSRLFVSQDGGETFYEKKRPQGLPMQTLSSIENGNSIKIQGVAGASGVFYLAMNQDGLWKLVYHSETDEFSAVRVTDEGNAVYAVGLGVLPGAPDYIHSDKAIYIAGTLNGIYGFYRSYDNGNTWTRINDDAHSYGSITAIDGDKRVPGRFFIATGSHGLIYGKES